MTSNPFSRKIDFSKYVGAIAKEFKAEVDGFCKERDEIIQGVTV